MPTLVDVDARIDALLARYDWWRLPPGFYDEMQDILTELYVMGLNREAARLEAMALGLKQPRPGAKIAWDVENKAITELIAAHGAEMVVNVENGTKYYLRQMLKQGWQLSTSELVKQIQENLFMLPGVEAAKLPRDRILSIVNYETNRAMSGAAQLLRNQLGLKFKQWFTSSVSPCDMCLDNAAQGIVPADFLYEGVFGQILHPPAHPRTCRCLGMAVESEVMALGAVPFEWPMTGLPASKVRYPP